MTFSPLKSLLLAASLVAFPTARAQEQAERPLPDIPTLMHEVEQHQRASETIQKDYVFHEVTNVQANGKERETREYDVFWLNGVEVHKLTRKDGRDLTEDEKRSHRQRSCEGKGTKEQSRFRGKGDRLAWSRGSHRLTLPRAWQIH